MLPTLIRSSVSSFAWNGVAGRYVDLATGRFVSALTVRNELEAVIDVSSNNMRALSQQLVDGTLSVAEWQSGMMENIKTLHVCSGAAANGGWAQMSQSDWGFVGQRVRAQYGYLRNFAEQVADGRQALNGQVLVRASMYGDAGRGTFEEMRRRYEKINNGMNFERRLLGAADHCPGCLEQAAQGWQPIGTLDPIGAEECRTNCHCRFDYSKALPSAQVNNQPIGEGK